MGSEAETVGSDRKFVRLWCPWCGKRHSDEGEFSTRVHRTHLCVDDVHGIGCRKSWRLDEEVFGSSDIIRGSNERHIELLVEIFDVGRDWDSEAMLAFGAAIRALRADDELEHIAAQIEERRARLFSERKHTPDYTNMLTELEALQRKIGQVVRGLLSSAVDSAAEQLPCR